VVDTDQDSIPESEEIHGNSKYDHDFPDMLIAWMSQGYSYGTFGVDPYQDGSVSIARSAFYLWEEKHPEWKAAKDKGYAAGLLLFESMLIGCASGVPPEMKIKGIAGISAENLAMIGVKKINLSAVIFSLKTRFHKEYSDKSVVDHISSDSSMKIAFVKPNKKEDDNE